MKKVAAVVQQILTTILLITVDVSRRLGL